HETDVRCRSTRAHGDDGRCVHQMNTAQIGEQLEAAHLWHVEIEEDELWWPCRCSVSFLQRSLAKMLERLVRVSGNRDLCIRRRLLHVHRDETRDVEIIIDDENGEHWLRSRSLCRGLCFIARDFFFQGTQLPNDGIHRYGPVIGILHHEVRHELGQ